MSNTAKTSELREELKGESLSHLSALRESKYVSEEVKRVVCEILNDEVFVKNKRSLERANEELANILSAKTHPDLLFSSKFDRRENLQFARTARFMGAYPRSEERFTAKYKGKKIPTEEEMYEREDEYYKDWLGKKFGFSSSESASKSLKEIDMIARKDIDRAIKFIERYISYMGWNNRAGTSYFRSQYFDFLHSSEREWTVRDYFAQYMAYEKGKKKYIKIGDHPSALDQYEKAQWEIRRILSLAMRFRDNERTPDAILHKLDDGVLVDKLSAIIESDPDTPTPLPWSENPLYEKTRTVNIFWKKSTESGEYDIQYTPKEWYIPLQLESAVLVGKKNPGLPDSMKKTFKAHHIQVRKIKGDDSRLEKWIRKPESQIMDQAGIVIVLDDFRKVEQLIEMITTELGTMNTSFRERLESAGNAQTSEIYRCKKCVIKIPHAFKPLKQGAEQANFAVEQTHRKIGHTVHRSNRKIAREHIGEITKHMETFSKIAAELGRDLYVEIQFFDLPSYIAAEIDEESEAYHERYKKRQRMLQIVPLLFPLEIYWKETLIPVYKKVLAEKYKVVEAEIKTP